MKVPEWKLTKVPLLIITILSGYSLFLVTQLLVIYRKKPRGPQRGKRPGSPGLPLCDPSGRAAFLRYIEHLALPGGQTEGKDLVSFSSGLFPCGLSLASSL